MHRNHGVGGCKIKYQLLTGSQSATVPPLPPGHASWRQGQARPTCGHPPPPGQRADRRWHLPFRTSLFKDGGPPQQGPQQIDRSSVMENVTWAVERLKAVEPVQAAALLGAAAGLWVLAVFARWWRRVSLLGRLPSPSGAHLIMGHAKAISNNK